MIGCTRKKTLTLLEAPEHESFLLPGDILVSPKAFYLVHSIRKMAVFRGEDSPRKHASVTRIYAYQYSIACTRLAPDDEAISHGRHFEIISATKEYLETASKVKA